MAFGSSVTDPKAIALTFSLIASAAAGSTEVTDLSATMNGKTASVSGSATFGEAPVLVGQDALGDNTGGPAGTVGLDIDKMYISQPTRDTSALLFVIRLASLTGGGMPDSIQYNWDIAVDGGAQNGGTNWSIKSARTSQYYEPGSVEPYAGVHSCTQDPTTGQWNCTEQGDAVPAVYDASASEIRISIPTALIKVGAGGRITAWPRNGDPVWVRPSALGAVTPGVTIDGATHEAYTRPSATVRLGMAQIGTPGGNVNFTKSASVSASGSFTGSITAPTTGSYDVWAKACFGTTCGTRAIRVQAT